MTKKPLTTKQWVIFNKAGEKLRTEVIEHASNLFFVEMDPFEASLKEQGLYAQSLKSLNQDYLNGKSFKEKLKCLGWKFDKDTGMLLSKKW